MIRHVTSGIAGNGWVTPDDFETGVSYADDDGVRRDHLLHGRAQDLPGGPTTA